MAVCFLFLNEQCNKLESEDTQTDSPLSQYLFICSITHGLSMV